MGKTGYQTSWNAQYFWIQPGNESTAHSILCRSDFAVSNRGHSQMVSHATSLKHKKSKESKQNSSLSSKKNKDGHPLLCLSSPPKMTKKERTLEDLVNVCKSCTWLMPKVKGD